VPSFEEVADRVWVARYPWFDVNVTAIGSARGLLVVDTHSSELAAREVVEDLRRLAAGPVIGIVNTHEHFDHTFGNAAFVEAFGELPIHAHEEAAARTVEAGERIKREYAARPDDPHGAEIAATRILPAGVTSPQRWSSTWATGSSSCSTPATGTPAVTWSPGSPTPTSCWAATWSRSRRRPTTEATATRSSGRARSTSCSS
jgi:hypothetical protein